MLTLPDRIADKIMPEPNSGCWLWTASLDSKGYAQASFGRGNVRRIHRYAYEKLKGPIPHGLCLDHLCRVRSCVNPDHLEPVTWKVNLNRGLKGGRKASETKCKHGHEYVDGSFAIKIRSNETRTYRHCFVCDIERAKRRVGK